MPAALGQGLASSSLDYKVDAKNREGGSAYSSFGTDGNSQATRVFLFDWHDWPEAYWRILGYSTSDTSTTPPSLQRYLPEVYPNTPWMVARKVDVQGIGPTEGGYSPESWTAPEGVAASDFQFFQPAGSAKVAEYKKALLTVTYEAVPYEIASDDDEDVFTFGEQIRYTSWAFKPSADYLTVPLGNWVWANDGNPDAGNPVPFGTGKMIVSGELSVTWYEVPETHAPWTAINDTLGRVNKQAISIPGPKQYPADQLLLTAAEPRRRRMSIGSWCEDITYTFKILPSKHTYFYDFKNGRYRQVRLTAGSVVSDGAASDGQLAFDERDYSKLFELQS
jgi:hypothetical protein